MKSRFFSFIGGVSGDWRIDSVKVVTGEGLACPARLAIDNAHVAASPVGAAWLLRGVTSNQRYTSRAQQTQLAALQPPLGRPEATCGALIPITKTAAWWGLTQDERERFFSATPPAAPDHTAIGMHYLPAIARQLLHGRDLGEPFDFLTWFEFAPGEALAFDELLARLRATEEWAFVEREVEIRVSRDP
ncbi:MAG: chlorite dismutase family protein [Planctomycetes bacterium]|nr:chlorite dismutase family protein [Planctomycetota bacterium]